MPWFTAHAIMVVEFETGLQEQYPVYENILLIQADDSDAAWAKAEHRARQDEELAFDTFTWESRSARLVFRGVRKLIAVAHEFDHGQLGHGNELSYAALSLASADQVQALATGAPVFVQYLE